MLEVADIFREAGPAYRQANATRLSRAQRKAMRDIEDCRTPALGGHVAACDRCAATRYSYHSCRNRHCPKCQGEQTRRWLDTQRSRLLPVSYFLLTFTLPAELRPLAQSEPRIVYSILMTAAAQALAKLVADPKFLGARPGMIAVLHTWTRALLFHPHVHFLVTAGGLSPDGSRWLLPKNPRFLVPGYALSIIFRAKVRDALKRRGLLAAVPDSVWKKNKDWVVHLKHAGDGNKVLDYLARYVFRVAITNSRLESFDQRDVRFRYRDNRSGEIKRCTLPAAEFIERFLNHVLPHGFTKVRYYGIYSPSSKPQLDRASELLPVTTPAPAPTSASVKEPSDDLLEFPPHERCPVCRLGHMRIIETIPRTRVPP